MAIERLLNKNFASKIFIRRHSSVRQGVDERLVLRCFLPSVSAVSWWEKLFFVCVF